MVAKKKSISPGLIGVFCAFGFIIACIVIFQYLQKNPGNVQKLPTEATQKDKTKSLEQINQDLVKQSREQQQSREWSLVRDGKIEEAIQTYQKTDRRREAEKRTNILRAMGIFTQKDDSKGVLVVDFLMTVLQKEDLHTASDRLTSAHSLVQIGRTVPSYQSRVEAALIKFWNQETRPGPKGKTLQLIAELNGPKGFDFIAQVFKNQTLDPAVENSLLYALNEYTKDPTKAEKATALMSQIATRQQRLTPLAVKLLALRQSSLAKKHVAALLSRDSDPAAIEAGAFAAGKLKMKEFAPKLQQLLQDVRQGPVAQTITQALNELSN